MPTHRSRSARKPRSRRPRKVGRKRVIPSPKAFTERANAYFQACDDAKQEYTVTGLALGVGLLSREGLMGYERRPAFADQVKRAKARIIAQVERLLFREKGNPAGPIFWLKNHGWTDRQDVAVTGRLASIDYSRLTDEQLMRMAAGEHPLAVLASAVPRGLLTAGGRASGAGEVSG